jgi:hypothetical protein
MFPTIKSEHVKLQRSVRVVVIVDQRTLFDYLLNCGLFYLSASHTST